ncbi:MAG: Rieske 2Fe-2S domain-containing protein [Betaproteobacteria bacterium]|nr:Rieske 2Fe-2S domain-containing protein [Betaproteobacteria bacterium]
MADEQRVICASEQLRDGGKGLRFSLEGEGEEVPAFAVRYRGKVYAYLNRCAHVGVELDWLEGEFWDLTGLYLICSTHGATYEPHTGHCVMGPCKGAALTPVELEERNGKIYLTTARHDHDRTV